jgi:hypothetical protein
MIPYSYLSVNSVCVDTEEQCIVTCVFPTWTKTLLTNWFTLPDGQKSKEAAEICAPTLSLPYRQNKFLWYTRILKLLHELGLSGQKIEGRNGGSPTVFKLRLSYHYHFATDVRVAHMKPVPLLHCSRTKGARMKGKCFWADYFGLVISPWNI